MSDNRPSNPERETGGPVRRWLAAYVVELLMGVSAALGLFLLLLWVLSLGLPTGTGFGELVRSPRNAEGSATRLGFEAPDAGSVAMLVNVRDDVRDRPASSVVWSSARPGTALGDRHAVQSYKGSGASIRFGEKQWLEMGENSVIVVRKPRPVDGSLRRRAAVLFMDGSLRGRLAAPGGGDTELELVSTGGVIRLSGQDAPHADVELTVEDNQTAVSVLDGTAEVIWGDEVTHVPSGYMVTYEPERAPGAPAPLPRPPRLLEPSDGARYRYRQAPPPVSFAWQAIGDEPEFRLQIARDPDFRQLVYDERLAASSFVHGNLGAGDYYWRVFRHRGSVAGPPTPVRQLIVEQHVAAPPLRVELPDGAVKSDRILIRGSTQSNCRVLIGETSVSVDGEGLFEHELMLQHGYNFLVVQSIDPTGNAAFRNHTILADLSGPERAP